MAAGIRKLPVGVQGFEKLRQNDYLYVDKTGYIDLLLNGGSQFFLSRPRRFGKSLFLSTLRAYWEGKRELFSGLAIEVLEQARENPWQSHPVFYFDMNRDGFQQEYALESVLDRHLREWEKQYGCEDAELSLAGRFQNLLRLAFEQTGQRCVVLVDEYDKPLLEVLRNPDLEEHNKNIFKGFFSSLKSFDEYLEFVFITGVTKFSKISIFSDLNQLRDISLDEDFSGICGITEAELLDSFSQEIALLAGRQKLSEEACLEKLRSMYDGYRFFQEAERVYNPFSLLNAFVSKKFGSFWFESGTPTFLVRRLREINFDARQFTNQTLYASERMLSDYRADNPDPIPLLYQTGYLTIRDYDRAGDYYTLSIPNNEVKYGLMESLMPEYVSPGETMSGKDLITLKRCTECGDTEGMRNILTALFASLPYTGADDPFENYFQSVIYIVFTLLGKYVHCELHSSRGRADCVIETERFVYLFEFKRDRTAEEALQQIERNQYAFPWLADHRTLYKIGVSFDTATRSLKDWREERADKAV